MQTDEKVPEDLGVKMGTPEEAFWKNIDKNCDAAIKNDKFNIEIQEVLQKHARLRIFQEKEKFKKMK